MPANKKYLSSNWQRFAKITAGFIGGYLVSISLHIALAFWLSYPNVIITSAYTGFIIWAVLMILAFLAKNGWRVWLWYIILIIFFSGIIYLGKLYNPIIS